MFGRLGALGKIGSLGAGESGASADDTAVSIRQIAAVTAKTNATAVVGISQVAGIQIETDPAAEFNAVAAVTAAGRAGYVGAPAVSNIAAVTASGAAGYTASVAVSNIAATSIERTVGFTWTNTEGETFEAAMSGTYSDAKLEALDDYISNLKSGLTNGTNTWGGHDVLGLHFLDNATDALRYFNAPSTLMTAVNSPTHTAGEGYAGDGTSAAINTNFTPSTDGVQFAQNSASLAVWMRSVGSSALKAFAGALDGSKSSLVYRQADGSAWRAIGPNGGVVNGTTLSQSATGLIGGNRSDSISTQVYRNGSSEGTGSNSSLALNTNEIFLLARNNTSPDLHSDGQISFSHIGRSFTANEWADIYAADNALLTAWAAA